MIDPCLLKLSKLCITKSFLCSFVLIADQISEGKGESGKLHPIVFACATSSEARCCQITVSWADSTGCRLAVSYVEGYLSCICAYSTPRSVWERVTHVLQVTLKECWDVARHNF